jgi:hypothetical protein
VAADEATAGQGAQLATNSNTLERVALRGRGVARGEKVGVYWCFVLGAFIPAGAAGLNGGSCPAVYDLASSDLRVSGSARAAARRARWELCEEQRAHAWAQRL